MNDKKISNLLFSLFIFDFVLTSWAFLFPELWFRLFHGSDYIDPQSLLKRCGANWAAFAILQFAAWRKWKKEPGWLALVAGVRLSDIFTDITCAFMATNMTAFGWISFLVMSPTNLLIGLWLFKTFKELALKN